MQAGASKNCSFRTALDRYLTGVINIPEFSIGIVLFAHGSGSGKYSKRNQLIARKLNENNIGTFLFDLLTEEEQESDRKLEEIIQRLPGSTLNKFNIYFRIDF